MPDMSLNSQIGQFLEFSGRSVWSPMERAMIPFVFRASLEIFLGEIFQESASFCFFGLFCGFKNA